jgi:hypothetical protein
MKPPIVRKSDPLHQPPQRERGITMVLVAIAMVAIIAMAALSIDVITLYLAKEEAQRSADAGALAAARLISLSGIMGDPSNATRLWGNICGGPGSPATQAAQAVSLQNLVGGTAVSPPIVTYSAGSSGAITSSPDCSALFASSPAVGVNPMVTVQIKQTALPTFFSRIWGNSGNSVSATASAEAFNPSNSGNLTNQVATGTITPVQPRCVKPWIVPNRDPWNPSQNADGIFCDNPDKGKTTDCKPFVSLTDGSIQNPGISLNGGNATGVIGETFWLTPICRHAGANCALRANPPQGNFYPAAVQPYLQPPPNLQYLPGEAPIVNPVNLVAVPACAAGSAYEQAVGGCDQSPAAYQCGVQSASSASPNHVDLSENPGAGTNDTMNGVMCMIHQEDQFNLTSSSGQDTLTPFAQPSAYPFQIFTGSDNPLTAAGLAVNTPVTSSNSLVSLPIYDEKQGNIRGTGTTAVTIVGFLQVFINAVDQWGNVNVTVLNVAGCGNGASLTNSGVTGSSPVPVRLITPP